MTNDVDVVGTALADAVGEDDAVGDGAVGDCDEVEDGDADDDGDGVGDDDAVSDDDTAGDGDDHLACACGGVEWVRRRAGPAVAAVVAINAKAVDMMATKKTRRLTVALHPSAQV